MKCLAIAAFLLTAASLPACAQRSGATHGAMQSSGGFHSGGIQRGSVAGLSAGPFGSRSPSFARPTFAARSFVPSGTARYGYPNALRTASSRTSAFRSAPTNASRRSFRDGRAYANGYGLSYVPFPYLDGSYFGDGSYLSGDGSMNPVLDNTSLVDPAEQGPLPPDPYAGSYPQPSEARQYPTRAMQPPPTPEEAVTLVFKDGHTQQIHNYLATRNSIEVVDGPHHHDIPVEELDIAATTKINHDAGVDFQLPAAR